MQSGLVSVIMPAYNAEAYIGQAIESVLAQSYSHWELVIVDDGSSDRTGEIASAYGDSRITLVHQKNRGEAAARNTALKNIQGEFLAFLDADDLYLPQHLESMVRYVSNAYHALKITFVNEVGSLSRAQGIDGQRVMEIFCADTQLNISITYLKPGYAFGGSCLPKDVRALLYRAKELDVDCEVLGSVLPSNHKQIERSVRMVERTGKKKVGFLGLSFKPDTDDLRESPAVILAETLLGKGYSIKIYDDKVELSRLLGANKAFLEGELPHIASLMCSSIDELISQSDVVVITNGSKAFCQAPELMNKQQVLIDLVGVAKDGRELPGVYEGIGW